MDLSASQGDEQATTMHSGYPEDEDGILDYDGDLDLDDDDPLDADTIVDDRQSPESPSQKVSYPEQVRMIHLRSHLNQLVEKVEGYRYNAEKTREELKKCQGHIRDLGSERDLVFSQIQTNESDNNTAALYRLRSAHDRVCQELQAEQDLEKVISDRLEEAEYELAKAEVEHGKFILIEAELSEREEQLATDKTQQAHIRLQKEQKHARQAENARQTRERDQMEAIQARERRHQQAMEDAKRSQERANKYLQQTMDKLRLREKEEETRYQEDMQRKMEMLLTLKNDIAANRENLRAIRARDKAREREETFLEQEERRRISQQGGNPDETLLIKKRLNEFEKQRQQFSAKQTENKSEILGRILLEEERIQRRKKQQPQLWEDAKRNKEKMVGPHKKKPLKVFTDYTRSSMAAMDPEPDTRSQSEQQGEKADEDKDETEDEASEKRDILHQIDSSIHRLHDSSDSSGAESDGDDRTSLAKPEFEGLWDQHKPYKVPKDVDSVVKLPGASKMDQTILTKVLEKHREGIIVKQVAAGREFSGCPFYSKPDIIHFKDFNVGQQYKKKVTLTNVSYTVNYCKYVGITERLKDFISIDFDPPGQMSAGLTCEMLVTFKPMINEDLEGEVSFLSQTGPFSISLRCTTKKCDLCVDSDKVEFGTTVIGETLKRTVTLSNRGALGTKFEFFKVTGMKQRTCTTAETSLGRLTTADTMRGMTPDSADLTEKQEKGGESKKKLSMDDFAKMPEASLELPQQSEGQIPAGDGPPVDSSGLVGDSAGDLEMKPDTYLEGEVQSPDFAVSDMDDYGTLDGMRVGHTSSGEIGPFASVKLEIIWQPTIPGHINTGFLITFADPLSEGIPVTTLATAMDVPVWVQRQTVDLKICMLDRLYQDTVIVNNRATTALRLKFEVCKELRNHLELLPKTGYIQAQSQFSAQLKFLPRKSLFEEAGKYFDKETGVLEAPMLIRVADQTQPVPFTVTAVVTNSDMEFDVNTIDFGCCTIYESVKTAIQLTNKSILPQPFGFVAHPDYVEVQPNDGFGTLLPLETIELHVIFSPPKAKDYKFELCCKSLINREFRIQCQGVGVHPPLELSQQIIQFAATSLYDVSTASLHVVNSHTSSNEFTHPVPRIGKGEIAPVGPTSFEFVLPEDCPLTISPTVGTIEPGKKSRIQIRFSPKLKEEEIRKEAVRMATRIMEAQADKEYREALKKERELQEQAQKAAAASKKPPPKGKPSPKPSGKGRGPSTQASNVSTDVSKRQAVTPPDPDSISKDSAAYASAIGSLLRQYKGGFKTYTVPCYVASGKCGNPGELPYSIHNTLYVEVRCPVVKPPIVVISDNGKTTLDFGEVSIGQHTTRSVTIQNISQHPVELEASLLDTTGPFQNLNALRMLPPGGTHTAVISFTPNAGRVFHEVLEVRSPTATLYLTLTGRGVSPIVNLSIETDKFDMGAVLVGEYVEKTFKIHNTSSLSIDYVIKMDSLSLLRHAKSQVIPGFVERDKKTKVFVGTQNKSGQNVFDLVPSEGTIQAGASKEIMVTFAPDHASDHFSDGVRIELFNQEESHFFRLIGVAKEHIMFLEGGDKLSPNVESLSIDVPGPVDEEEAAEAKPPSIPLLVTLSSVAKDDDYTVATRDIHVGCVRTMAVSQKKEGKKNGEFQVDNLQAVQAKGFNMDPQRGMIEAGSKKAITVTWTPPQGYDPTHPAEGSVAITLKGDVTEQIKVILRAMVVTE